MDVCHVINQLAPGGAPTLIRDIVEATQDDDVNYTLCYLEGDDSLVGELRELGVEVHGFGGGMKFDPRVCYRMFRFFRRRKFDIVHAHLPYSQTLTRLVTVGAGHGAIVSTQHNVSDNYHPVTRATERLTRSIDDVTVSVSTGVETSFGTDRGHIYPDIGDDSTTIYNGIDVESFHDRVSAADTALVHDRYDVPEDELLVLNVARYTPAKGQLDLVDAVSLVDADVHLVLVGWGPLEEDLRERAAERNVSDRVTITGRVPDVEPFYRAADVFSLPSHREGFGIVLIEAMAAQLPVVATDIRGVREVVEEGETGVLVPVSDPAAIATAIDTFGDEALREAYGRNGFDRVAERFDIRETASSYLALYRRCLDAANGTSRRSGTAD